MLTIAWDVDDVLNDLMRLWLERAWLRQHTDCSIVYEDLHRNPPHEVLGASLAEYLASLDDFRLYHYLEDLPPLREAQAWFERNGARYRHVAITEAPLCCVPLSAHWVLRHFGRWVRTFHFVPSPRCGDAVPVYERDKKDFLQWFGRGDVIVDDREENVTAAQELGIRAYLMPRPWNRGEGTPRSCFGELAKL